MKTCSLLNLDCTCFSQFAGNQSRTGQVSGINPFEPTSQWQPAEQGSLSQPSTSQQEAVQILDGKANVVFSVIKIQVRRSENNLI